MNAADDQRPNCCMIWKGIPFWAHVVAAPILKECGLNWSALYLHAIAHALIALPISRGVTVFLLFVLKSGPSSSPRMARYAAMCVTGHNADLLAGILIETGRLRLCLNDSIRTVILDRFAFRLDIVMFERLITCLVSFADLAATSPTRKNA